ncbi:MAG: diaminobutyrate acetyltransferase [Methylocystaceae bacterium]|nr:diaminobutyrate acetyltransferase [Methylocystaceae bacterium]
MLLLLISVLFVAIVNGLQEAVIFTFEIPQKRDGRFVYDLITSSPPLDVNSRYAYFLLCDHFASSSIICREASDDEKVIGFVGGYRKPTDPETLFVWQIAVDEKHRGKGLPAMMLDKMLQVHNPVTITSIEATYTPSNKASYHFFTKYAKAKQALANIDDYLSADDFGSSTGHEEEKLIKIFLTPMPTTMKNKEK